MAGFLNALGLGGLGEAPHPNPYQGVAQQLGSITTSTLTIQDVQRVKSQLIGERMATPGALFQETNTKKSYADSEVYKNIMKKYEKKGKSDASPLDKMWKKVFG